MIWDCRWVNFVNKVKSYGPLLTLEVRFLSLSLPSLPIFFKLSIQVDTEETCFGIADGLISSYNLREMALDLC